jgi:hypothetical protein
MRKPTDDAFPRPSLHELPEAKFEPTTATVPGTLNALGPGAMVGHLPGSTPDRQSFRNLLRTIEAIYCCCIGNGPI